MEFSKSQRHDRPSSSRSSPIASKRSAPARQPPLSAAIQRATADPRSLSRADSVALQRTIGNAAMAQLFAGPAPRANRTGLPDRLKAGVEDLSGIALDDVRVHYNSPLPARFQALAYAQAPDIHIAPGQEKHLPHEAWHVVQQKQGRVKPTLQMKGVAINDDDALEREADAMGRRAEQVSDHAATRWNRHPVALALGAVPVVQREEAVSWAGTFIADPYEVQNDEHTNGAKIVLTFKPNQYVDATRIGLVQAVLPTAQGKAVQVGMYDEPRIHRQRQVPEGQPEAGWEIDKLAENSHPLYAADNPKDGQTLGTTPELDDKEHGKIWGEYGHRVDGADGKENKKDATLKDEPGLSKDLVQSKQVFETAALAVAGDDTGLYYGSVEWGWQKDAKGQVTKLPFKLVGKYAPSINFFHAAVYWDQSKTTMSVPAVKLLPDEKG